MSKFEPKIVIEGNSCTVSVDHGDFGWTQMVKGLTPEQATQIKHLLEFTHQDGKRTQMEIACATLGNLSMELHKSR